MSGEGKTGSFDWKQNVRIVLGNKRKADLVLALENDNIQQKEFFQLIVDAYIEKDKNIRKFIDSYLLDRAKSKADSRRIKDSAKLRDDGRDILEIYGITDEEIENVYKELEEN